MGARGSIGWKIDLHLVKAVHGSDCERLASREFYKALHTKEFAWKIDCDDCDLGWI